MTTRIEDCYQQMEKKKKKSRMENRKNGVACTIALVIQMRNTSSRRVAISVRIVLLLMIVIPENMKTVL